MLYHEPISTNKRTGLYVCSLLIPLIGIVIGIRYMDNPDAEHRSVGRRCIIFSILGSTVSPTAIAAALYVLVLGM